MSQLWTTKAGFRSVWSREISEARLIRQGRIRASGSRNLILNTFHDLTEGFSLRLELADHGFETLDSLTSSTAVTTSVRSARIVSRVEVRHGSRTV